MAAELAASSEPPHSLRDALRAAGGHRKTAATPSESPSEEDYDEPKLSERRRKERAPTRPGASPLKNPLVHERKLSLDGSTLSEASSIDEPMRDSLGRLKTYVLSPDDRELRDVIKRGLERVRTCALSMTHTEVYEHHKNSWWLTRNCRRKTQRGRGGRASSATWSLRASSPPLTGKTSRRQTAPSTGSTRCSGCPWRSSC